MGAAAGFYDAYLGASIRYVRVFRGRPKSSSAATVMAGPVGLAEASVAGTNAPREGMNSSAPGAPAATSTFSAPSRRIATGLRRAAAREPLGVEVPVAGKDGEGK